MSSGALSVIATTENLETTVYCEKVEQPMKWRSVWPLHLKRLVSSGIKPRPCVARTYSSVSAATRAESTDRAAEVGLARLAELALAALGRVELQAVSSDSATGRNTHGDDMVAHLDVRDSLADRLDNTAALVAKHDRERSLGVISGELRRSVVIPALVLLTVNTSCVPVSARRATEQTGDVRCGRDP